MEAKMVKVIIGVGLGAVGGFLYYRFVGCSTGTCPITSNPVSSIIYGALVGYLVTGFSS